MPSESEVLNKLWNANEILIQNFEGAFSKYFAEAPQKTMDEWEYLVASTFHISIHRLKGLQFLLSPQVDQCFYMEGAILARNLFESWVTLAWLNHQDKTIRAERVLQFKNSSIISQFLIDKALPSNTPEPEDVKWVRQEALKIYNQFPKGKWKIPSIEKRVGEIFLTDTRFQGMKDLFYETIYRDFSHYVHLSYRTILEMQRIMDAGEISLSAPPSVGFNCLQVAGGPFLYTAEIWNSVFMAVENAQFQEWAGNWLAIHTETSKKLTAE